MLKPVPLTDTLARPAIENKLVQMAGCMPCPASAEFQGKTLMLLVFTSHRPRSPLCARWFPCEQQHFCMPCPAGAESLGSTLMLLFFATIGAGAGSLSALRSTGWLTGFILILLVVHLTFALVAGRLVAGCSMRSVLTASNANIGGPATAAAMAASRGWKDMVRPAMLTGSLGYSIGTALGCAVGQVLQRL